MSAPDGGGGPVIRVGIVGVENSHVDHIIAALNGRDREITDARVVGLAGPPDDRMSALLQAGGIEHRVDQPSELLDLADVLVVDDRHGGLHREHAMPFLRAGKPVYVDKPLACSVADGTVMTEAATASGALLTSYSTMRWVPELTALATALPGLGELQSVTTTGRADPTSEYGGVFFYGIHPVDVALRLAPGAISDVRVRQTPGALVLTFAAGSVAVTVNLVRPDAEGAVGFHALAVGSHGVIASELPAKGNYVRHALTAFLDMVRTGVPPVSPTDLLRPIEVLEQVQKHLDGTS